MDSDQRGDQLWLELPPVNPGAPSRLLVFLHAAGSSPEAFAPVAIAWQLKFPGAVAVLMQGLRRFAQGCDWFDSSTRDGITHERAAIASDTVRDRIGRIQQTLDISPDRTVLIGHAQGATLALEMARKAPTPAGIIVAYSGRLARPVRENDAFGATVHLIHGEFDSVVPSMHSSQAFRGLTAIKADVSLDIVGDEAHAIGQDLVNVGTTRVMQTLFRGRRPNPRRTLH